MDYKNYNRSFQFDRDPPLTREELLKRARRAARRKPVYWRQIVLKALAIVLMVLAILILLIVLLVVIHVIQ